jgi:hypothetical protein
LTAETALHSTTTRLTCLLLAVIVEGFGAKKDKTPFSYVFKKK